MAIKTRQTTATGVTNKDAPLTNDELDNNFVELVQGKADLSGATFTGDVTISSSDPQLYITDTDTGADHALSGASGVGNLVIRADYNSDGTDGSFYVNTRGGNRARFHGDGDISFYDTSSNAKFFWDASASRLGLGTTSPDSLTTLSTSGGSTILELNRSNINTTGAIGTINFTASDGHSVSTISALGDGDNEGAHLTFRTTSAAGENSPYGSNTFERVRITSTGDLLVGTTVNDGQSIGAGTQNGTVIAGESVYIQRSDNANLWLSKPSGYSNSEFVKFYTDSTLVGSIGATSSQLWIGNNGTHLLFHDDDDHISPWTGTAYADGTLDLGKSSARYKDFYLGGDAKISNRLLNSHGARLHNEPASGLRGTGMNMTDAGAIDTGSNFVDSNCRGLVWTGKYYIAVHYNANNNKGRFYKYNGDLSLGKWVDGTSLLAHNETDCFYPHGAAWDGRYLAVIGRDNTSTERGTNVHIFDVDNLTSGYATRIAKIDLVADLGVYDDNISGIGYAEGLYWVMRQGTLYGFTIDFATQTATAVVTKTGLTTTSSYQFITYDGNHLYAGLNGSAIFKHSLDGTEEDSVSTGVIPDCTALAWNGHEFIGVEYDDGDFYAIPVSHKSYSDYESQGQMIVGYGSNDPHIGSWTYPDVLVGGFPSGLHDDADGHGGYKFGVISDATNGGNSPTMRKNQVWITGGVSGEAYNSFAAWDVGRWTNSGTDARSRLDLYLGDNSADRGHAMTWLYDEDRPRVGINTVTPSATLTVNGDSLISNNDQAAGAKLTIENAFTGSDWNTGDKIGTIEFRTADTSTTEGVRGKIELNTVDTSGLNWPYNNEMNFYVASNNTLNEALTLKYNGSHEIPYMGGGTHLKVNYSDAYASLYGYGLLTNRSDFYLRPVNDSTQTLHIGHDGGTQYWGRCEINSDIWQYKTGDGGSGNHIYWKSNYGMTTDFFTAYNATTGYDLDDENTVRAISIRGLAGNYNIDTWVADGTDGVLNRRYVGGASTASPMVYNTYYRHDGAGSASTDMIPPSTTLLERWQAYSSSKMMSFYADGKLEISGDMHPATIALDDINGTATSFWKIYGWDDELQITTRNSSNGTYRSAPIRVSYTDSDVIFAGEIEVQSDERIKENIKQIEGALEKVQAIRGVTFTRNDVDNKEREYVGVIAQEVEKVLPQVVKDGKESGIKSVAYANMVGLLIEAIKEQQTQIDDLKAEVTRLKGFE